MTIPGQGALPVTIEGIDSGRYTTDGTTLTVTGLAGSAEATVGGFSGGLFASEGPGGGSGHYTCMEDTLTVDVPELGMIAFARIEETPKGNPIPVEIGRVEAVIVAG
jgi:hypothetical protein